MFCPNCGTQNEEGASPCKKCGFKLSGVSAPKFKGTMMLSSDRSVQQLVEEHRRKLEERAASSTDAPASVPEPDLTNSKPGLNTVRGGLQPVRPALPRSRLGGTVIGVAPQIGGFTSAAAAVAVPMAARDESVPAPASGERALGPDAERPFPEPAPAPLLEWMTAAPNRPEPSKADATGAPESALRRNAEGAGATLESAAPPRLPDVVLEPSAAAPSSPAQSITTLGRARVRPLEVFLILITFGLYGLVLLFQQRRQEP